MIVSRRERMVVLDWGIGGLPTFEHLRARGFSPVYISDAGAPPYGTLEVGALAERIRTVVGAIEERPCPLILACNAASTAILSLEMSDTCVLGILQEGVRMVRSQTSPGDRIAILGGQRTIDSGLLQAALGGERSVVARVAQRLSAHVEAGRLSGPRVLRDVGEVLRGLEGVDALLLACTHYPALRPMIELKLPGVQVLDPSPMLAIAAADYADEKRRAGGPDPQWFTTGDVGAMVVAAERAFGLRLGKVEKLHL